MFRPALPLTIAALLCIGHPAAAAPATPGARACTAEERARLLAPPLPGDDAVALTCSATLAPGEQVTRRVVIEGASASGVRLACNGAAIGVPGAKHPPGQFTVSVFSDPLGPGPDGQPRWSRPTDVTLEGCTIHGGVRVWGMGLNGQGEAVRASSRSLGHTARAQAAAPARVAILGGRLVAQGGIPLYLGPGVTDARLENVAVTGRSSATAVYLDAESAGNTISGNRFDIETGREVVAVDGSAGNRIADNRFVLHGVGAVHLYRNCGEGGTVRHQTPSDNTITGNRFRHAGLLARPAIVAGSREGWRLYCGEDAGYPFGSSLDNGDHAERNRIEGNGDE